MFSRCLFARCADYFCRDLFRMLYQIEGVAPPKLVCVTGRIPLRKNCVKILDLYRPNNPALSCARNRPSLSLAEWVLKMTGDTLYTIVVLLAGSFAIFLSAVWLIERRGNRRRKAKRERRKFKL